MDSDKKIPMLILRKHSHYARLLEFYYESGQYNEISRDSVKLNSQELKINGIYDFLDGKLVALYVLNGAMLLRIVNDIIPVDDITSFKLSTKGISSTLHICYHDITIVLNYKNNTDLMIEDDFTPFVEEEDFDFGLYIKNLIFDRGRMMRFLNSWGS